jgi:2-polyprenyl-3-methyl-5-hydroxy-6-metoxy-1,4-benzoquinol methylase
LQSRPAQLGREEGVVGKKAHQIKKELSQAKESLSSKLDLAKDSLTHKLGDVRHDLLKQVRHARYGIMTFLGFFFLAFLFVTGPIWMMILMFNLPIIIALYITFFYTSLFNPIIKLFWRLSFGWFSSSMANNTDLTITNVGFATTSEEDIEGLAYLQGGLPGTFRNHFDRFRYQLYQYVVIENGQLESLGDKAILETGCGRGGGLNYLAQLLHPRQAIGVDMSRTNIEYCRRHWPKGSHVPFSFVHGDVEHLS